MKHVLQTFTNKPAREMEGLTKGCKKLEGRVLEYSADSVEWCPVARCAHVLLCGTYQLKEADDGKDGSSDSSKNKRIGKLYTFEYKNCSSNKGNLAEKEDSNGANKEDNDEKYKNTDNQLLSLTQEIDMAGILDVKWSYKEIASRVTYAIASADGEVSLWVEKGGDDDDGGGSSVDREEENKKKKIFVNVGRVCNEEGSGVLALSLDWDNAVHDRQDSQIVVSYSDGGVALVRATAAAGGLQVISKWRAHDFEAWISAFNYHNTNLVYTGGDDCKLKGWDLRSACNQPTFVSKQHQMGVCGIQQNFLHENILATGSYDERLLLWDQRSMKTPLEEIEVGGGVWRVKWEPHSATQVAVAAMHGGFHVIDCAAVCGKSPASEIDASLRITASYHEHKSLAYGVDWCKLVASTTSAPYSCLDGKIIASCSFYDCLLNLWNLD